MPSTSKQAQSNISSYFSASPSKSQKRRGAPTSPIDLTSDADYDSTGEPPIKKVKVVKPSQSQSRHAMSSKSEKHGGGAITQSAYFSQRTSASPVPATNPNAPRNPFTIAASLVSRIPSSTIQTEAPSTGMAKQWAFASSANPRSRAAASPSKISESASLGIPENDEHMDSVDEEEEAEKAKRHEAFKRKLLADESRFLKLRPGALGSSDTSAAVVTLGPEDEDDVDVITASKSPAQESEDSGEESDVAFKELTEMFANKRSSSKANNGGKMAKGKNVASQPSQRGRKKPPPKIGPSGEPYTPLELQVLVLKENNPGTVLMVEVGYKYRFFGNDAKIAAKELGMVAFQDRNFLAASIPVHRRDVHLKKLLARGYRVGIVNQVETAALKKVSDNRNAPFDRRVTHLFTAATYVDDLDSVDDLELYSPPPFMCLVEEPRDGTNTGDVNIGMISICPSTGDVIWDDFEDSLMRIELETRLVHIRPAELLIPKVGLSAPTSKMLQHFSGVTATGEKLRKEHIDNVMSYTDAFSSVTRFYSDKKHTPVASENIKSGKLIAEITAFPKRVVVALAHAIKYLSAFGIADALLETAFFNKFTTRTHMLLGANTLINLEVYRNEIDHTAKGSLMLLLNKTETKFGARLLKSWIGRPLVDKRVLQDRVDAVEEILGSDSDKLVTLRQSLRKLPDLARGLCRIQYGQCTPQELSILLPAFNKIATAFEEVDSPSAIGFNSHLINEIIYSLPKLRPAMQALLAEVNLKRLAAERKDLIWTDPEKYPGIIDADMGLQQVEIELAEELKSIRKLLKIPSLQWTTVANDEYLVEVKKADNRPVPDTWIMHSRTTKVIRYQPLSVKSRVEEKARFQEILEAESNKAYQSFLKGISDEYYGILRDTVNKLAVADCILSLARVALEANYVKPEFTDDDSLEIIEGRHPTVEMFRDDPFVPNSITMGFGKPRSKIITGPNMGGKSSFVRMVALIALMAQDGRQVLLASEMNGVDKILLASDDLAKGRSTFMVEMSETSDILHIATSRSLVILDELGRGTSTFDGMAIADAVLQQLVENTKCKTLFITHYPLVASAIERKYPKAIENVHMGYTSESRIDDTRCITFLYKLVPGITTESFGIECARLAALPESLLGTATRRAQELQEKIEERVKRNKVRKVMELLRQSEQQQGIQLERTMEELRSLTESLSISTRACN